MLHFESKEAEIRYNDLARHIFVCRIQKELLTDARICQIMYRDNAQAKAAFMDYVNMIKTEIDNILKAVNNEQVNNS